MVVTIQWGVLLENNEITCPQNVRPPAVVGLPSYNVSALCKPLLQGEEKTVTKLGASHIFFSLPVRVAPQLLHSFGFEDQTAQGMHLISGGGLFSRFIDYIIAHMFSVCQVFNVKGLLALPSQVLQHAYFFQFGSCSLVIHLGHVQVLLCHLKRRVPHNQT